MVSLRHYGSLYKHWAISFSGGKDSSAVVTLVIHLIETGQIPKPESLTVIYADTRQELPPLHNTAIGLLNALNFINGSIWSNAIRKRGEASIARVASRSIEVQDNRSNDLMDDIS